LREIGLIPAQDRVYLRSYSIRELSHEASPAME